MDLDTIIRLAREVWDTPHWNETQTKRLVRFAALVAAHEREAMVALAAKQGWAMKNEGPFEDAVREIAAIRSRT